MLSITVSNDRQYAVRLHETGPLVLGRRPGTDHPHVVIDDKYVSRTQLVLEETGDGRVSFENLGRNGLELATGKRLLHGQRDEVSVPTWFRVGTTTIHIGQVDPESSAAFRNSTEFRAICRPVRLSGNVREEPLLAAPGETPTAERLTKWFETLLFVQRSAMGSQGFYRETARALVDLVGLEQGLVLLRRDDRWITAAGYTKEDGTEFSFSDTVLNLVLEQRRTFYGNPQGLVDADSVTFLEAVVASPILDDQNNVIGAIYGSRDRCDDRAGLEIQPLESQLVQLLAATVSNALIHLKALEQLRRAEQLAAVGKGIGYVLHDLRGPLANVQQLVEIMRQGGGTQQTLDEQLGYIDESVAASLGMLNECMEFCRGEVRIHPKQGTCRELLGKHLEMLKFELAEFDVSLRFNIPDDLIIILDPDRIARVLRNLAKNACEAVQDQPGGEVTIGARAVADGVEFWVKDNGGGLPEEIRDSLFEPFVTYGKAHGTGFGLAIAHQLVRAHDGQIRVASGSDGTCFTLTLPFLDDSGSDSRVMKCPPQTLPDTDEIPAVPHRSLRILLAEDSALSQKLMASLLEEIGHRITIASNGREAVRRWKYRDFDVILMDIEMPEMDGLEAAKAIRRMEQEQDRDRPTPIVALTGHGSDAIIQTCLAAGMNACVTKPVHREALRRLLDELAPDSPTD